MKREFLGKSRKRKIRAKIPKQWLKKKEIEALLEQNRAEIEAGKLRIFFVDECHLLWGDACGYVWGRTDQRIELPIKNEKEKQTYYGALDYVTGQVIAKPYPNGNTENTIKFVQELIREYINLQQAEQIIIIWDGALYHRSQEFRNYLDQINQETTEQKWLVKCFRLAPNAPEQNPIEEVWLQGKEMLRTYWHLCQDFKVVKWLFEWTINNNLFNFPKLSMYGSFS